MWRPMRREPRAVRMVGAQCGLSTRERSSNSDTLISPILEARRTECLPWYRCQATSWRGSRTWSANNRIAQKIHDVALTVLLRHGATDGHHQRHSRVDLLLRLLLGGVEIAAPVRFADHIAHAPLQHRIAIVPEPPGAHRGIQLDDRWAEVLRRRPELQHVDALGPQPLRHLGRL